MLPTPGVTFVPRMLSLAALWLLGAMLAGCAAVGPAAAPATAVAAPAAAEPADALPKVELTSELLFRLVFAEIAVQRGEPGPAYFDLMTAARQTRDPRIARRAMEIALGARQMPEALEAAGLWNRLAPADTDGAQAFASLLVGSGRYEEARPLLEHQLAITPNPLELLDRLRAMRNHALQPGPGQALLQALGARYCDDPATAFDAHLVLARGARAAGDDAGAIGHTRAALALRPGSEGALMAVVQLLADGTARAATSDEALSLLSAHLQAHPDAADVRLVYARVLVGSNRLEDARQQFEELLRRSPDSPDPLFALGVLALEAERYADARGYFERYLDKVGSAPDRDLDTVYMNLSRVAEGQHRLDEALQWLHKVSGPDQQAAARERQAFILARLDRVDEALVLLRQIPAANDSEQLQRTLAEGQLLREARRYQQSYDLLDKALQAHPDDAGLLYECAMTAERLDRIDLMEARLRHLIALRPDNAHAYNALGYSLADRNIRLQEAYQLIDHALSLAPDDGFIVDSMGWVQYRLGNLPAARDALRRAFAIKADPDVAAHLGEVLWASGDHSGARQLLLEAHKRDGDSDTLRETLQRLKIQP